MIRCNVEQTCKNYDTDCVYNFVVKNAILEHIPNAEVVMNLVPKKYAMSDIYCQLIPNDDDENPFY